MNLIIGIGEYVISNKQEDTITTYALASCVGVTAYCPSKKVAGMIHIALPEPLSEANSDQRIGYYATTGLPVLFQTMQNNYGCKSDELNIHLFGGANSIRSDDVFFVGQKNIQKIKGILNELGLEYSLQQVGGIVSRTIEIEVKTGSVKIDTQPIKI
jgi:chemotaxis protein CheD